MNVDEVLRKFQELADTIRAKSLEPDVVDTELELCYEACASSIERVINEVRN